MKILNKITQIIFPDVCIGCNCRLLTNENHICTKCDLALLDDTFNYKSTYLKEIFLPHFPISNTFSLFYFNKKSPLQLIIHDLKYKSFKKNGIWLGRLLNEQDSLKQVLDQVDYILPIPIHKKRLRERGYNQSELIAKAIDKSKTITYNEDFIRSKFKKSQTSKSRVERWENLNNSFQFIGDKKKYDGKHVLIVDDVITTGSTIISFINLLDHSFSDIKISVASVAVTLS